MPAQEHTSPAEAVALALAWCGCADGDVAELVPQAAWDSLYERGLLDLVHPLHSDAYTRATLAGCERLRELLA